jgi:predicted enzyme related to lactoylglutathione lyase
MVGWFEIPVTDMNRAKKFYDAVFDITIGIHEMGDFVMGWFPNNSEKSGATGSLVLHEMYTPSLTDGPLIYFSCEDVATELSRVEGAGGVVTKLKTQIGDGHGYMATISDTEGNRIALHSQS